MIRTTALLLAAAIAIAAPPLRAQEAPAPSPQAEAPEFLTSAPEGDLHPERYECELAVRSGPYACPREVQRRWRRHQNELELLAAAAAIEGPEFSQRKMSLHVARAVLGVTLIAGGAVCLGVALVYGLAYLVTDGGEEEGADLGQFASSTGVGVGTFAGGIVGLGVGVPLLISGARGKHRQSILREADRIRAPFDPFTASLTIFADPRRGAGGVALRVAL